MSELLRSVLVLLVVLLANRRAEACVAETYKIQPGDICVTISARFGISLDELYQLNPFINKFTCNNLFPGQDVKVCASTKNSNFAAATSPCVADTYKIQRGDICTTISARFGISLDELYKLNPFINKFTCNNLFPGQDVKVCASSNSGVPASNPAAPTPSCNKWQTVVAGDTCLSLASKSGLYFNTFMQINKGLQCDRMYPGDRVCIGAVNLPSYSPPSCPKTIKLPRYSSCGSLASTYPNFYALNPGIDCNNLQWDQPICVESSGPAAPTQASQAPTDKTNPTTTSTKSTTTVARANYTPSKYCVNSHKVTSSSETCNSIVKKYAIDYNSFITINTGIKCHTLRSNDELCVRAVNQPLYKPVNCLLKINISPFYQCSTLSLIYKNFLTINPGINCDNLQYDQSVCIQAF